MNERFPIRKSSAFGWHFRSEGSASLVGWFVGGKKKGKKKGECCQKTCVISPKNSEVRILGCTPKFSI